MKKRFTIIAVLAVSGMIFADAAFAGRVANRQVRQTQRIGQGVASGELTVRETRQVARQQKNIQKTKKQAWSDGVLTPKERIRIEAKQDRASRNIYRKKHNDITR